MAMEDIATRGSGPLLPVLKGAAERHQERVKPSDMSWDDAQAFVNFTVLVYRGAGTASMPQVRREAIPGRRWDDGGETWPRWSLASLSSLRCLITLPPGTARVVRLKMCCPDLGPCVVPLALHMLLGEGRARVDHALPISDGRVGWVGLDKAGKKVISMVSHGTLVEFSVRSGSVEDSELVQLCKDLEPASMASARQLVLTPFAQLSYWMRYSADASPYTVLGHVRIPTGLFNVKWPWPNGSGSMVWSEDLEVAKRWLGFPAGGQRGKAVLDELVRHGWSPDSVCSSVHGESGMRSRPVEVALVCRPREGFRHRSLWLRSLLRFDQCPISRPEGFDPVTLAEWDKNAKGSAHPITIEHLQSDIAFSWADERYGPWEAVFWAADRIFLLQETSWDNGVHSRTVEWRQFARSVSRVCVA